MLIKNEMFLTLNAVHSILDTKCCRHNANIYISVQNLHIKMHKYWHKCELNNKERGVHRTPKVVFP